MQLKLTLALLCEAIRMELLTVQLVSELADGLSAGHLRFDPGEFASWADENGLLA